MAEMQFNCPKCAQLISCDEQWIGQEIQCPTCQAPITVPAKDGAAPGASKSLVPEVPKTNAPKLSIGQTRHAPPAHPPVGQQSPLVRNAAQLAQAKKKKDAGGGGGILKIVGIVLALAAVGAGVYFLIPKIKAMQDKANASQGESDGGEFGHAQALNNVLDATDPANIGRVSAPRRGGGPPPPRPASAAPAPIPGAPVAPVAVVPPVFSLDTNAIKIPSGKVNGMISGTAFVSDNARLDVVGTALVLRFFQGALTSPDRAILVYLHLKPGEKLAGHNWLVAADTKGGPQIYKMWKATPGAPQSASKSFTTGYVMDLQFDKIAGGQLSGKIFLALPDTEQSVIGGEFQAATKLPDSPAAGAAPTAGAAAPSAATPKSK